MAPALAIEAHGVKKQYRLGELSSLGNTLRRVAGRLRLDQREAFAALHDVTFDIPAGESFGIVGHNGSGKSTLLHMICGITLPTSGAIVVRGRVLPLLAVGTSFHGELTGLENIALFGAILGIDRETVESRVDDIAAFAELDRPHLETPLKRFSDGMQARLSFAIAMLFPADVYVFDEVLAVVDGGFRDRCLNEIENLRDAGKTVLFVSHDNRQVARLCGRVLWLEQGAIRAVGPAHEVLDAYERSRSGVAGAPR